MKTTNDLSVEDLELEQEKIIIKMRKILKLVRPIEIQVRELHLERENLKKLHLRYERRKFALTRTITKAPKPKAPKVKLGKTKKAPSLKELFKLLSVEELKQLLKEETTP